MSLNTRAGVSLALMFGGLGVALVQFVGLNVFGLGFLWIGTLSLYPLLAAVLVLEAWAALCGARPGARGHSLGGIYGFFTGAFVASAGIAFLIVVGNAIDPLDTVFTICLAIPILAGVAGACSLAGVLIGSNWRGASKVPHAMTSGSSELRGAPSTSGPTNVRIGAPIAAAAALIAFGFAAPQLMWTIMASEIPVLLLLVLLLVLEGTVCVQAFRRGASAAQRGGLVGAGIGLIVACFAILNTVNDPDPFAQAFLYPAILVFLAVLVGGGALLGIVVGLGVQLARGR